MALRPPILLLLAVVILSPAGAGLPAAQPRSDPFAFLRHIVQVSEDDRQRIDDRGVMVRVLPADGHELATLVAGSLNVGPDALLASARNIAELKKSSMVPQVGRFSPEPRLEDLRDLTLDDVDINEIRRCRPQRCGLKLAAEEIARLQQAIAANPENSRAAVEGEFRRIVLSRATEYLRQGDRRNPREFSTLLDHSPYLHTWIPELAPHLQSYPAAPLSGAESFLYWSKETYAWKPMISVTHVTMVRGSGERGGPEIVIASRDVFVTRYTSGSFVLTLLFPDGSDGSRWYLVYLNRTWIDGLRGLWRPFVEYRIKSQARNVFADARRRIERNGVVSTSSKQPD
jgi:hypothetical protein